MYLSHSELSSGIIFNNYKLKILLGHLQFYSNNWKSFGQQKYQNLVFHFGVFFSTSGFFLIVWGSAL